ncbi:ricin B-like lectin [Hesseltinella vesiculosa]|uniref:Ricin B-like lectin n=1 Tax=Hesseltinella vesiculosa TaxID=101127 RepID=A0A1X2GXG9_9FUNG|nr:ricin B-like lectin [Hesseltinella vesiculosa]
MASSYGFPQDTYFYIKSVKTGLVLDVFDGQMGDDACIITWPQKMNDNDNQLWSFENGFLTNYKSKRVLDIRGGDLKSDCAVVQYAKKSTKVHNQRFGFRDGYIYVISEPRLVFDIKGGSDKQGTGLIVYKKKTHGHENQQWELEPFEQPHRFKNPFGHA